MVSDQEPRYRLVDSNGNIVGSLYGKADGSLAIQETTSGSDREVALAPDGTFSVPSVETESVNTEVVNNTSDSVGTTAEIIRNEEDGAGARLSRQRTIGVGQTETEILNAVAGVLRGHIVSVLGDEQGSDSRFSDLLHIGPEAEINVISSEERNTPVADRTYDVTDNGLTLAMDSDDYDIQSVGVLSFAEPN